MVEQSQQTEVEPEKKSDCEESKTEMTCATTQTSDDLFSSYRSDIGTDTFGDSPVDDQDQQVQTAFPKHPFLVPIGTPVFMPVPAGMYATPYPVPMPIPVPVATPVFVPTVRNSERGVKKEIRRVCKKFGLEAQCRIKDVGDSDDSDIEENLKRDIKEELDESEIKREPVDRKPTFFLPPLEDIETVIKGEKVIPKALPMTTPDPAISPGPQAMFAGQKRKFEEEERFNMSIPRPPARRRSRSSRGRSQIRTPNPIIPSKDSRSSVLAAAAVASIQGPKERPDAKHHLKFTYGVNAWKHWVVQKNAELEKARSQGKYLKTFETDILKLRADELIYTLCMFVKEVRKPNGDEYTPDSMLYLTLGIQEYLFENGRIDNIFMDMYYEPFTSALHDVVKDFKLPVNELGYFITRVEEEHLWEAKQLGAHSPQVLLNTLIYFNAKYFLLTAVEQHKRLAFSHIVKHWKRATGNSPGRHGGQNPQSQQKTILLRCPVKLYEFYLSKCPETSKTRNDLFYLQPERSCVPDSPVWYSGAPLGGNQLDKMLQRLLMIREIQEQMLADGNEN